MRSVRAALRRAMMLAGCCCLLWFAGLLWFATPPAADLRSAPTDAIVVLTGGSLRLRSGIDLLREGKGAKLFISGVDPHVDFEELLRGSGIDADDTGNLAACCIAIGHQAENTLGNAAETARWIHNQGFHSLRLVTAWYHMPRSLIEFERAMPDIEIIPHPVFPDRVKQDHWWEWPGTAGLLVNEYVKYLATLARPLIRWPQPEHPARLAEPARAEMGR